jgi:hypothetical protein
MWLLALQQLAVAAFRSGRGIFLFRTLFVQVPAPAPQTTGRLFAVRPDVAKLLAVVALREGVLCSICLYLDGNVAEAWRLEDFLGFFRSRQGY